MMNRVYLIGLKNLQNIELKILIQAHPRDSRESERAPSKLNDTLDKQPSWLSLRNTRGVVNIWDKEKQTFYYFIEGFCYLKLNKQGEYTGELGKTSTVSIKVDDEVQASWTYKVESECGNECGNNQEDH